MCWLFCVSVLFFTFATSDTTLLDKLSKVKWRCADKDCSVPISEGFGLKFYNGDDPMKVNFNENDQLLILGKPNEQSLPYWLVQVGDKKGIAPVHFIRERIMITNQKDQVETELDLSSIIQSTINIKRSTKEAIKPSSPNLVIDGTTLPPYEEDEVVIDDDDSEEVFEFPKSQVIKNPSSSSDQTFIKSDSPLIDETNETEASKGFATDKEVNTVSDNVSAKKVSDDESFIKSSGIKTSTIPKANNAGTEQNVLNDRVENVHSAALDSVNNLNETLNNQSFIETGNISRANESVTNQGFANNEVESIVDVTGTLYDKNEESNVAKSDQISDTSDKKTVDVTNGDKNDPKSELTNIDDVDIPSTNNEPLTTDIPLQPNDEIHKLSVNEEERTTESVLNIDANITSPPTESPKEGLPAASEMDTSAKEDVTVSPSETDLITESFLPAPKPDSTTAPSVSEGEIPSPIAQSVGNSKPSDIEKPSLVESIPSQHASHDNVEKIKPVVLIEDSTSSIIPPVPPIPPILVAEPITKSDSLDISNNLNSDVSYFNDYNHNDTGDSELLSSNDSILNPDHEEPFSLSGKVSDGSDSEPLVNQPPTPQLLHDDPETLLANNLDKDSDNENDYSASLPESDSELPDIVEEGDGWFSGISSIMNSFTEMFTKSDIGVDREDVTPTSEEVVFSSEKIGGQQSDDAVEYCAKDAYCPQWRDNSVNDNESKGSTYISEMFGSFSDSQMSLSTLLCLVITSIVVLLFSLGHYYLENLKQDTSLVAKINTVSAELFFAQKELASIEEQYQLANENYRKLVSETSNNETTIEELRKELEESKAARGVLEDEIKRLEKEIESLVEEGDEMHRMLAESFSEEERTKSLLTNISDLKGVLSDRLQEIVSLTEQLDMEKQEVELLTISLNKSEEKREATEEKLTKVLIDADSKTLAVTKEFEEKITTLERIIEERSLERTNFEKQLCELKGTCESLMVEKELAEKELKKAHGVSSGKALNEWLEAKQLRTDLLTAQKEAEKLKQALEETKSHGAILEEKEKQFLNEIKDLNNKYESAEKDKIDALTKLQVLSNYFKEKEIQLQEELGIKESQWLQKQSEDHTIYEQMRSLREENLSYKAQNDALKKEILDQETSFKIQIANEEQKAQENWINLRHTERRLKEVQMEAAHLRSRLTALEANPDSLEDKHKSLEMVNGDVSMGAASPPFMLYPPPDYIPPPPLVSPTRPPPLGRLSSPPLTPPAPLSPYEFYPPPPPSPPPPLRVHKPQPREPHRKQKDSQSSNHSSESADKPIRRGKR